MAYNIKAYRTIFTNPQKQIYNQQSTVLYFYNLNVDKFQNKKQVEMIPQPNNEDLYFTNNILFSKSPTQDIYFVPAYARLKCKGFSGLDLKNIEGVMNATIFVTVFYGNFGDQIVDQFKKDLVLETSRSDPIPLKAGINVTSSQNTTQKTITFVVRKYLKCRMEPNIFWTPFQILNMILTVNLRPLKGQTNRKNFTIRFNFMDHVESQQKIYYTQDCTFGQHNLAQALTKVEYSNRLVPNYQQTQLSRLQRKFKKQKKNKKGSEQKQIKPYERNKNIQSSNKFIQNVGQATTQEQLNLQQGVDQKQIQIKKIKSFQFAHFILPLYKFPFVSLLTIYLPLWYISVISLGNFFVANIIVIANRMIAFAALLPLIRSQLATSPNVTFTEILVYIQSGVASFMCLANLVEVNYNRYPNFPLDFVWQENVFFIISAATTLATVIIVAFQILFHWLVLQPSYNKAVNYDWTQSDLKPWEWRNPECDKYFKDKKLLVHSNCLNPYQRKGLQDAMNIMCLYYSNKLLSHHED